eukprot:2806564-Amphidinium_carterae.1
MSVVSNSLALHCCNTQRCSTETTFSSTPYLSLAPTWLNKRTGSARVPTAKFAHRFLVALVRFCC